VLDPAGPVTRGKSRSSAPARTGDFQGVPHADPYDYYARLRRVDELLFDTDLRMWIASRTRSVEAVLAHPDSG